MSEGTAVVFQEGDRVKFECSGVTDYGTVVEVEGSVYTDFGNVWAFWDATNMKEHSRRAHLTLLSRKEQPKPAQKHYPHRLKYYAHKYADVIKHWADGGEIQYKYDCGWIDYESRCLPNVDGTYHTWRIKPEAKNISYRVGITKDNQVKVYHKVPTLNDSYNSDAFKDWLDPEWRSVEVEV